MRSQSSPAGDQSDPSEAQGTPVKGATYIFVKDRGNNILFTNEAVANSLGVELEEIYNTPSSRWYPKHAQDYFQDDLEVIRTGKPKLRIEEPKATVRGEVILESNKFPLIDEHGDVNGVLVIARETEVSEFPQARDPKDPG